jgi:hypothetical protein
MNNNSLPISSAGKLSVPSISSFLDPTIEAADCKPAMLQVRVHLSIQPALTEPEAPPGERKCHGEGDDTARNDGEGEGGMVSVVDFEHEPRSRGGGLVRKEMWVWYKGRCDAKGGQEWWR